MQAVQTFALVVLVVYVVIAGHLIDVSRRLRSFERDEDWLVTALGWPYWLGRGGAALTTGVLSARK